MMLRLILFIALAVFVARAFWKLVDNFMEGLTGQTRGDRARAQQPSVQMARCAVCGTFVVPDRALSVSEGSTRVVFCSAACRDKYRLRTA
jgi:hypothetical protein